MTSREAMLQAVVLRLLQEPTQISVPVMDGPNLDERLIDEWVCQHCGHHGDAADMIEHADDCDYVAAKAALWPSGDRSHTSTVPDKIAICPVGHKSEAICGGCSIEESNRVHADRDRLARELESERAVNVLLEREKDAAEKRAGELAGLLLAIKPHLSIRRQFEIDAALAHTPAKEHCPRRLMGEHQEPHAPCDTGDFSRDAPDGASATYAPAGVLSGSIRVADSKDVGGSESPSGRTAGAPLLDRDSLDNHKPCGHPFHMNAGLITACPECGVGEDKL